MNLAISLTFSRMIITPLFVILYIGYSWFGISSVAIPYILLVLVALSELSDIFDGHFARKYNQVTDLGKVFDPMVDGLFRISVFLAFTQPPVQLPLLWVFVLIYRDFTINILRTICALKGYALAARTSGKLKAIFQAIVAFIILLLMIPHSVDVLSTERLHTISTWLVALVALYTTFSGIEYIVDNWSYIHHAFYKADHS